ncbi:MAG: cytochrome b/b6 domain-containing protein [Acidisphaera sp.]|nr:cytochrome b/b6 domain-containing protein [Acidisphaera sp.]
MSGMRLSMRVWDLPIRLFHWAIVVLLVISYLTERTGRMQWHFYSGYTLLTLLIFRLIWGFVGSDTARFRHFLKSPAAALRHLAQFHRREPDNEIGHNAAGGWMVLVILLLLAVQVVTGLFARDDDVSEGPFRNYVSDALSDRLSYIHYLNFNYLILTAVALHVLAVLGYAVVKRHNLLRPMITGKKRMPAAMRAPRMASPVLALLVLACAAGAVTLLLRTF